MLSKYKPDKNISKQLMLYEERRREKNNQVMTWVSFAVEGIFRLTFAVWEKTEEDALGSEVATTFDGFSRRFVFSCYVNFSFHKTETTDAHLSSPSANVYYSIYRVSWQQVSLFVWSRVHAEKTEENGPERKMMYFIYVLSIHFSTPNVSQKMPSSAKLSQVIIFPSPFLIKHQLFWDIFVRFIFWQHSSLAYLSYSNY